MKSIISVIFAVCVSLSSIPSTQFSFSSGVTTAEAATKKKSYPKKKAPSKPRKKSPPVCKTGKRCGNSCIPVTSKCSK